MTTRRAAIYARISRDKEGAGLGVERQQDDCRALAEKLDVTVVATHVDNDMSAYSGKPRPGYRKLLGEIRDARVDVVLAWHTDRLHRSPVELEEWIAACEPRGVAVHTVKAGLIDLSTPSGRAVARTLAAWAKYDVEDKIEKQQRQKQQAAAAGKWRGGPRPFGYEADGMTVRKAEADVVKDATSRVLAGETLHSVCRDLDGDGVTTSSGGSWKSHSLRTLLLRARNAALIEHSGELIPAAWPPIVDAAAWRNLRRMLTADGRRPPRSEDLVWMGSGLYLCGVCADGTTVKSASGTGRLADGSAVPTYRCRAAAHLSRVSAPLDEYVTALVHERLSRPDAPLLLAPEARRVDVEALHARRADVAGRLTELASLFADGAITGAQLTEATHKLRAEGERLDAEIAATSVHSALAGYADSADVRAAWVDAPIARRKAIVRELMTVTVLRASRGRPRGWRPGVQYFDPTAIAIEWRRAAS